MLVAAGAVLSLGCEEAAPASSTAPTSSALSWVPSEGPRRALAGPAAFDVTMADVPILAWHDGDVLRVARLDEAGGSQAEVAVASAAVEVDVGVSGGRLGLAWTRPGVGTGEVVSQIGAAATLALDEPVIVGQTRLAGDARGRIALAAAPDEELMLLAAGERDVCEDSDRSDARCTSFAMQRLPLIGSQPPRPRLAVPAPCRRAVIGVAVLADHWHYAVCNATAGREESVLFTAQPSPSYAQANELLAGCEPDGFAVIPAAEPPEQIWLTARCGASRAAVRARGIDVFDRKLDLATSRFVCDGDGASLSVDGHRLPLVEPNDSIAPLLPADVAPPGARAVWTGDTLLVAVPQADSLLLQRHRCSDGRLSPLR